LKTYSLGIKILEEKGGTAAIPYFKRAIELDPNFASAYAFAATEYWNIGESGLASEYGKRAYELRERVTEREKLDLEVMQTSFITGDLVKDEQAVELWKRTYPRDLEAYKDAAVDKGLRGDFQGNLQELQRAMQINRFDSIVVGTLAGAYVGLDRLDDAKTVLDQGLANGIDPAALASNYYMLAFVRNDTDAMQKQLALVAGNAGYEDGLLSLQSDTEAYHGRLNQAREYSRRATESAQRNGMKETAAGWAVNEALREAELGNLAEARRTAALAMQLSPSGRYTRGAIALALARTGDTAQAQQIGDTLKKEFPQDTIVNVFWRPATHAAIELNRHNPAKALEVLATVQGYEWGGSVPPIMPLLVLHLRGKALLETKQNKEAAAEFQKILDHQGIALNSLVAALANLGSGRAFAAAGETAKARTAYQDFFALWKDADPNIPILKQAKAEYAKLQ
jgi:thioredoxin-like negative regulator of GroEL